MKVLFVTSSYPRSRTDTASVFLRHLAAALNRLGVVVEVVAPADRSGGIAMEEGISVTRVRYLPAFLRCLAYRSGILSNLRHNRALWLTVPFFCIAMFLATWRRVLACRPDLIHAHWILPQGLLAVLAGKLAGVPVVITAHGSDAFALRGYGTGALKRWSIHASDAWTANTESTARAVGNNSARIIPMGVDIAEFSSGRRQFLRSTANRVVLFVGRLVENKGVDDLIRAFALLSPELRRNLELWIVGEGRERQRLERLSMESGSGTQIRFLGAVANEELPDYFAAADLLVGPSVIAESGEAEGQGVVFLEAFAARVPVIATDVGGIGEIVRQGETGRLVPPHQPAALARAMEDLLQDAEAASALAECAFQDAMENYDWKVVAPHFKKLYEQVLDARARCAPGRAA